MEHIFVSYKFRDSDREVAENVKRLLKSHLLNPIDGEDLGGEGLTDEIKQRIRSADALVALFLLPQEPTENAWVRTEYQFARNSGKRTVAVVEEGYAWTDPENREYVKLIRSAPLAGFLKLSTTVGLWRRDAGRRVLVRLLPEMVARLAAREGYTCRYRLTQNAQPISDWMTVTPGVAVTGIGFPASGIRENVNIEIEVNNGNRALYFSAADPSSIPAELKSYEQR